MTGAKGEVHMFDLAAGMAIPNQKGRVRRLEGSSGQLDVLTVTLPGMLSRVVPSD